MSEVRLFLPIYPGKFLILTYGTMSLFLFYWIFRTWRGLNASDGKRRWPGVRTFFAPLTTWSALASLRRNLPTCAERRGIPLGIYGIAFGFMALIPRVLLHAPLLAEMLFLAAPLTLLPAVNAVNKEAIAQGITVSSLDSMTRNDLLILSGGASLWLIFIVQTLNAA